MLDITTTYSHDKNSHDEDLLPTPHSVLTNKWPLMNGKHADEVTSHETSSPVTLMRPLLDYSSSVPPICIVPNQPRWVPLGCTHEFLLGIFVIRSQEWSNSLHSLVAISFQYWRPENQSTKKTVPTHLKACKRSYQRSAVPFPLQCLMPAIPVIKCLKSLAHFKWQSNKDSSCASVQSHRWLYLPGVKLCAGLSLDQYSLLFWTLNTQQLPLNWQREPRNFSKSFAHFWYLEYKSLYSNSHHCWNI